MNLPDNRVKSIHNRLLVKLSSYEDREARNIVDLVFHHLFGISRADLLVEPAKRLSESEILRVLRIEKELLKGRPIQHILGEVEFFDLKLKVNESVLIPRPETEELVQLILSHQSMENLRVLDIGTGSGCIALALKSKRTLWKITSLDISNEAVDLAKKNAVNLGLSVDIRVMNILTETPGDDFDLIVSNPPYIPQSEKTLLSERVRDHEPKLALFVPDNDALIFYRRIGELALNQSREEVKVYVECHEAFADAVVEEFNGLGLIECEIHRDLQDKPRFVSAKKSQVV